MRTSRRGFALMELTLVLAIIGLVAVFAIPNLVRSRMTANETSAVGNLRNLLSAEAKFLDRHNRYGSLTELYTEGLIDSELATGQKAGYRFGQLDTGSEFAFCFGALPIHDGRTGEAEYTVTQENTIYEATIDSRSLTPEKGVIDWTPGTDCPADFTTAPENNHVWSPINE